MRVKSAARKQSVKQDTQCNTDNKPASLRVYVAEAEEVDLLTKQPGWGILLRDLTEYKDRIGSQLAYLNPKTKEYEDSRILFIASDKLIGLVEDYDRNKREAIDLLKKIDNPQENIILDVDN